MYFLLAHRLDVHGTHLIAAAPSAFPAASSAALPASPGWSAALRARGKNEGGERGGGRETIPACYCKSRSNHKRRLFCLRARSRAARLGSLGGNRIYVT